MFDETQAFWSTIQGVRTLYYSRLLRFSEKYGAAYQSALGFDGARRILEIGCGPGALAKRLRAWYPESEIVAIDRDRDFLAFAREQVQGVQFQEGDATALPFAERSFDAVVSYTVQEHVEPGIFLSEQFRVLKEGGACAVISCRPGSGVERKAPCVLAESPREQEIWKKAGERFQDQLREKKVGAYWLNEQELPLAMERAGFQKVTTAYLLSAFTPDHPQTSAEEAQAILAESRLSELDAVANLRRIAGDLIAEEELAFLEAEVNRRHDERLRLYEAGEKQWDCTVVVNLIVRGEK